MEVAQVVLLIGAVSGLIVAVGGSVTPIVIARMKRDEEEKPEVEQGQPIGPDTVLKRERNAYRRALNRANDRLAQAGLPLEHPDL